MNYKTRALGAFIATFILALGGLAYAGTAKASDEPCVPQEATSEVILVTPAVPAIPEIPAIPAVTEEVFDHWQHYSWTGGPHSDASPPAFPSKDWQPNVQGDPHRVGVAGAYFRSHSREGGAWFYLEAVEKTIVVTPEVPAVPGTPEIPAVTEVVEHPAVVCPEIPTETPSTEVPVTETQVIEDVPSETPVVVTEEEQEEIAKDDPIVTTETHNEPSKTTKTRIHESGRVTKVVKVYPEDTKEEGL